MSAPLCLKPGDWPEIDQRRWREAREPVGFLSGPQPAQAWSERRRRIVEQAYGQWLAFLERGGLLDPAQEPGARASPEAVEAFLRSLQERVSSWSLAMMAGGLLRMFDVMAPAEDWSCLRRIVSRLKSSARPERDRRGHMVDARQLYALGLDLMDQAMGEAERHPAPTRMRDGLLIALLTSCPIRIRNLAAIRIGEHLRAGEDCYGLVFEAEETKTGRAFESELPQELTPFVETYLRFHRSRLLARGVGVPTDRFWIDRFGRPMSESAIRTQIEQRTKAGFGRHVWPHLFRSIAATGFVDHAAGKTGLLPDLLGHASVQTTRRYYVLSEGAEAHRAVQAALLERRRAAAARLGGGRNDR